MVANQLARLGGYQWREESDAEAGRWATRVPPGGGPGYGSTPIRDGRAGFHRYHSAELVHRLDCAQLPAGMLAGIADTQWPVDSHVHVAVDDDGDPPRGGRRDLAAAAIGRTVVEGGYEAVQRVGGRSWRVPVTAFWQAHRDAPALYSALVTEWASSKRE